MHGPPAGGDCSRYIAGLVVAHQRDLGWRCSQPLLDGTKEPWIGLGISDVGRHKDRLADRQRRMCGSDFDEPPVKVGRNAKPKAAAAKRSERVRHIVIDSPMLRLSKMPPKLLEHGIAPLG